MSVAVGRARLSVLAAAALFSTGGAAIKGTTLTAIQVAGFRSAVAAIALALLLPEARRGWGRDLLPAAFCYAGTLICFVFATKLTTAAAAIFLQATAPIWVLVLAPLLIDEPIRPRDLPFVLAAAGGLILVFLGSGTPLTTAPRPAIGNALGLAAGLFYAGLMISFRRLARDRGGHARTMPATVLGNVLAFVVCLPFALPVASVTARDAGAVVYLGAFQVGLAYWLFNRGLSRLTAIEVSLLVLLEPVLNPLWTWLLHAERPSALALAGGGVMLAALAARILFDRPVGPVAAPPPD